MSAPYLAEPETVSVAEANAAAALRQVYRVMVGHRPALQYALARLDGTKAQDAVPRAGQLEDDYGDVLALVGSLIEACGGRVPA